MSQPSIKENMQRDRSSIAKISSIIIAVMMFVAYAGLLRVDFLYGMLRDSNTPKTIGWYLLAFVAYIAILIWVDKQLKHPSSF